MTDSTEELEKRAREVLGSHWQRRCDSALDFLIDAEGLLAAAGLQGGSLGEVCQAIRNVCETRRYG